MKKIRLKNNSSKKKFNSKIFKFLFLVFVVYVSSIVTVKYFINSNINITDEDYVNYLLSESYNKKGTSFIVNESIKLLTKIDLSNPSTLLDNRFKDDNVKTVSKELDKDAKSAEDNYDSSVYEKLTSYVSNPSSEVVNPEIYLYNSHQLETYSSDGFVNTNITPNVMMTSYLLAEKLNKEKINTIAEDTNINSFIKSSNLASDAFYASTRIFLKDVMNNKKTIKYFIDIHRDAVGKKVATCTIGDKSYARILFVLGTTNTNYLQNKKIMDDLDNIADTMYPGLSRGVFQRATPSWPDSYNQDLNPGVMLIEVGDKENTMDEVINTTEALSKIFKKYMRGE